MPSLWVHFILCAYIGYLILYMHIFLTYKEVDAYIHIPLYSMSPIISQQQFGRVAKIGSIEPITSGSLGAQCPVFLKEYPHVFPKKLD